MHIVDSSCKTLPQYKEDLLTLKHIVDTFPSKKQDWKIVGGDISGYVYNVSNARQLLQSLRGHIDYFMYENASLESSEEFPDMSMRSRLLPKGNFKIWTTAPKSQHAVTFSSALEWARQIGDAARGGFSVVFRQPRLHEFFVDTPVSKNKILFRENYNLYCFQDLLGIFAPQTPHGKKGAGSEIFTREKTGFAGVCALYKKTK